MNNVCLLTSLARSIPDKGLRASALNKRTVGMNRNILDTRSTAQTKTNHFSYVHILISFTGAADEGLPRKQRKVRMKENIDTTCGGVSDAGSHWARTTYSAPWSVITSAPRSVPLMLKLATLPRSRRERDWWRATPGRGGKGAALPLPAESPAERAEGCVP